MFKRLNFTTVHDTKLINIKHLVQILSPGFLRISLHQSLRAFVRDKSILTILFCLLVSGFLFSQTRIDKLYQASDFVIQGEVLRFSKTKQAKDGLDYIYEFVIDTIYKGSPVTMTDYFGKPATQYFRCAGLMDFCFEKHWIYLGVYHEGPMTLIAEGPMKGRFNIPEINRRLVLFLENSQSYTAAFKDSDGIVYWGYTSDIETPTHKLIEKIKKIRFQATD